MNTQKPRIRHNSRTEPARRWKCTGGGIAGYGATVQEAYIHWRRKKQFFEEVKAFSCALA